MAKEELTFDLFLSDIPMDSAPAVTQIHKALTDNGCQVKLQAAKSGHVVSYTDPKTKKTVANFVARKKGPMLRLYGDNFQQYFDVIEALPDSMKGVIEKASSCKRLLDPTKCNSRCTMGFEFTLNGTLHKKCRYNCFMFLVDGDSKDYIEKLVTREMQCRA